MPINVNCPQCNMRLAIPEEIIQGGRSVKCPQCQNVFKPQAAPGVSAPPPPQMMAPPPPPSMPAPSMPPGSEGFETPPAPAGPSRLQPIYDKYQNLTPQQKKYGTIGGGVAAFLVLVMVWWCAGIWPFGGSYSVSNDFYYAPDKAQEIESVNFRALMSTDIWKKAIAHDDFAKFVKARDADSDGKIEKLIKSRYGIELPDLERITSISTKVSDLTEEERTQGKSPAKTQEVVIVHCRNANKIDPESLHYKYKNKQDKVGSFEKVYTVEGDDDRRRAICIVDNYTLVLSDFTTLKEVLKRGKRAEMEPGLSDAIALCDFSAAFVIASSVRGLRLNQFKDKKELQELQDHEIRMIRVDSARISIEAGKYSIKGAKKDSMVGSQEADVTIKSPGQLIMSMYGLPF